MKSSLALAALAAVVLALSGCGGDEATKDPAVIEEAFKEVPAEAAPAAEESTTDAVPVGEAAAGAAQVQAIAGRAATAMRKDDLNEAVVMLQALRRARNLSPGQLGAVQDQMAALQMDLANRAANGDQKAAAALRLIQQTAR